MKACETLARKTNRIRITWHTSISVATNLQIIKGENILGFFPSCEKTTSMKCFCPVEGWESESLVGVFCGHSPWCGSVFAETAGFSPEKRTEENYLYCLCMLYLNPARFLRLDLTFKMLKLL